MKKKFITLPLAIAMMISLTTTAKANADEMTKNNDTIKIENYNLYKNTTQNIDGWICENGSYYHYSNSNLTTGWFNDQFGDWYYLDSTTGAMQTGWFNDGYDWYYFNDNGTMQTGWFHDGYDWYYFNSNGTMKTGLSNIDGFEYFFRNNDGVMLTGEHYINNQNYFFDVNGVRNHGMEIVMEAKKHIGKPYRSGSTGPNSFDCSGFTQYVYKQKDITLGRSTYDQIYDGYRISSSDLKAGDLVFTHAGHVGIYVGNNEMIHSPRTGDTVKQSSVYSFYAARRVIN